MHKLTRKRQVTVPKKVCDALGLAPGDYVEIFERDGVAHLVKRDDQSLAGTFAYLTRCKSVPNGDEIKYAVKRRAAKKFTR